MRDKKHVFRWRAKAYFVNVIVLISLSFIIGFLASIFNDKVEDNIKIILVIIVAIIILLNVLLVAFSFYFGWSQFVYFDNDKVRQRIRGRNYEWYWNDMTDCKIIFKNFRIPLTIEIATINDYKKLRFFIGGYRYKKLIEFCPNERIKELIKKEFTMQKKGRSNLLQLIDKRAISRK